MAELSNGLQLQSTDSRQSRTRKDSTRPQASYQSRRTSLRNPANGSVRAQHPSLHNALPERPQYSLAGNSTLAHGLPFVDPQYHELNPSYQRVENAPVWGLAKPLPRVVRSRMRRGRNETEIVEDNGAEREPPGSAEAIPQLGMIGEQRHAAGKDSSGAAPDTEERGYGHERVKCSKTESTAERTRSENSFIGGFGTPKDERSNPLEEWRPRGPSYGRAQSDLSDDHNADLGNRRLSKVEEVPSRGGPTSASMSAIGDWNEIDLETGNKLQEWPVEDEEAERYAQEAYDDHNLWASIRARFREPLAECLATMVAVLIGTCTNLAVQTSADTAGVYQSSNWAWGLGTMIGIYVAGGISGGHLNPAISLMLNLYRGFPLRKALVYIIAQVFGAFLAGLIAYAVYRDAIIAFDARGGQPAVDGRSAQPLGLFAGGSGKAFFTKPATFAGIGTGFANEFVATTILACAILALGDDSNAPPGAGMHAMIVGLVVTVLTMAFGYNTGACLNPARDLGPRLAVAAVGYGSEVFTVSDFWWIYGPWGATISGSLVGGLLYDVAIFVGGESPVNYPRSRRRKVKNKVKRRWFGVKKGVEKGFKGELGKNG